MRKAFSVLAIILTMISASDTARGEAFVGSGSADTYILKYMLKSDDNFLCVMHFLQEREFSRDALCANPNSFLERMFVSKKLSVDNQDDIKELERKIVRFLLDRFKSR